jgi:hypothetical protein
VSRTADISVCTGGFVACESESAMAEADMEVPEALAGSGAMVVVASGSPMVDGATVESPRGADVTAELLEPGGEEEAEVSGDTMRETSSVGEPIVKLRNADRNVG